MPIIGSNLGQSVAGASAAERVLTRPADKRPVVRSANREKDELITDEGVRSVKSNDQEEAREDHQQRGAYTPGGKKKNGGDETPRIDVAG